MVTNMALGEAGRIEGMMFPLGRFMARDLRNDDAKMLDEFIIANRDFFETLTPNWATEYTGENILASPTGIKQTDRHLWGIFDGEKLIAIIDLIANFPSQKTWSLGQFIIDKNYRLKGIGIYLYDRVQTYILLNSDCGSIRITVPTSNTVAMQFWKRNGFESVRLIKQEVAGLLQDSAVMQASFY